MDELRTLLLEVLSRHADASKWSEAPFGKIRRLPNTKVGEVGQDYIESLCEKCGFDAMFPEDKRGGRSKQSPWDIQINNVKFELKTATEDTSGCFQFNHFRYARNYDALLCLGIAPEEIFFNVWTKAEATTGKAGTMVSMEKSGSASYKLTKRKDGLHVVDEFARVMSQFLEAFEH